MLLLCPRCRNVHTDPGGDPRQYACNRCGQQGLERVATKQEKVLAAGVAGATIGGLALGPIGALAGGIIGVLFGENQFK